MTKWLTEDPAGKWLMTLIGAIVVAGVVEPLKAMPVWAHIVGAAAGMILGLLLQFSRKPVALLATTLAGACAPWYVPILRVVWYGFTGFLRSPYEVLGWVLLAIAVVSAAVTFGIIAFLAWLYTPPTPSEATMSKEQYRSDDMFGAFWRWEWGIYGITHLAAFCPRDDCQNQLVDIEYRGHGYPELICVRCQFRVRTPGDGSDWHTIDERVKLEILRRVRKGEFRQAINSDERIG